MKDSYKIMFNSAVYALGKNVGSLKAAQELIESLDSNVHFMKVQRELRKLYGVCCVEPGGWDDGSMKCSNEDDLKVALATKIELMLISNNVWK